MVCFLVAAIILLLLNLVKPTVKSLTRRCSFWESTCRRALRRADIYLGRGMKKVGHEKLSYGQKVMRPKQQPDVNCPECALLPISDVTIFLNKMYASLGCTAANFISCRTRAWPSWRVESQQRNITGPTVA